MPNSAQKEMNPETQKVRAIVDATIANNGIDHTPGGGTTFTGAGIELYKYVSTYLSFKLWIQTGLNPTRNYSVFKVVKEHFKLKGNKYKVFEQLTTIMLDGGAIDKELASKSLAAVEKVRLKG